MFYEALLVKLSSEIPHPRKFLPDATRENDISIKSKTGLMTPLLDAARACPAP